MIASLRFLVAAFLSAFVALPTLVHAGPGGSIVPGTGTKD